MDELIRILDSYYGNRIGIESDDSIARMNREFADKIISWAISNVPENPYPENIFIPPTDEQYEELYKALQKVGLTIDKFSRDLGSVVWKYITQQTIKNLKGG